MPNIKKPGLFQDNLVNRLMGHVVRGEQASAEKILKSHPNKPDLLFMRGVTQDIRNSYFGSPLDLAAFLQDVPMLKMMSKFVSKDRSAKYSKSLFAAYKRDKAQSQRYNFNQLIKAFNENNQEAIDAEIQNFHLTFSPKVISLTHTKSFDRSHFLLAHEIGIQNLKNWSEENCARYWDEVIGFLQKKHVPIFYLQMLCSKLLSPHMEVENTLYRKIQLPIKCSFRPPFSYPGLDLHSKVRFIHDDLTFVNFTGAISVFEDEIGGPTFIPGSPLTKNEIEKNLTEALTCWEYFSAETDKALLELSKDPEQLLPQPKTTRRCF